MKFWQGTSRKIRYVGLVAVWALAVVLGLSFSTKERPVFPSKEARLFYAYGDSADGGHSSGFWSLRDSTLSAVLDIRSGIPYPYAGIGILLNKSSDPKTNEFLDFTPYDSICITLRSGRINQLYLKILTFDPALTVPDKPLTARYLLQPVPVSRSFSRTCLALGDFTIPEWWFTKNRIPLPDQLKYLNHVFKLDVSNAGSDPVSDTLSISGIELIGRNRPLIFILAGISLLALIIALMGEWLDLSRKRMAILFKKERSLDSYDRLPVESRGTKIAETLINYIGTHYSDGNLSVEAICRETGINRNKLSEILKQETGMTFNVYVNELRLKEAARLLRETDRQVAEIADSVGYGSPNHFNRIFKQRYGLPPHEYSKRNQ